MSDRDMWLAIRRALLIVVDAIERRYGLERTAELRKENRINSEMPVPNP